MTTSPNGTLDLLLPDWSALDNVRRHPLPFALWNIGDQGLLFHWFDHAVNEGFENIRIHVLDRPTEVRKALASATLWPIPHDVVPIRSMTEAPPGAESVDRLPGQPPLASPPADGWELLDHAAALESVWLDEFNAAADAEILSVGSSCRIHPDAVLTVPYFIGDGVFVGPGCEIGPHAIIGAGSMLAGANLVVRSQLAPHTFLGPVTGLEDCLLDGGILFNRRHRARVDGLESHLSSSLAASPKLAPPPWRERLLALRLAWRLGAGPAGDTVWTTHDGIDLPAGPVEDLRTRLTWLRLVWTGRFRLFGVLPRTREQLESLPPDWRGVIENARAGVFSYADCHGSHSSADPDEALHAVYQAGLDDESIESVIKVYVMTLSSSGFPT